MNDTTIDLNGFGIVGPVTCTGTPGDVECGGQAGPFQGIGYANPTFGNHVRVHGGYVIKFGTRMKNFLGKTLVGRVVSVHLGNNEDFSKEQRESLMAEIGGFAGDKHHGTERTN